MQKTINIICIHWGTAYSTEDVNKLYSMIKKNTSHNFNLHVFSNEILKGLNNEIIKHPEPKLITNKNYDQYNYRKEVGLCDNELGGLNGERVFFFDLDVLITNNLDELFSYPEDDKFYIINDWNSKGNCIGQATCYSFVVGTLGFIKSEFEENSECIVQRYGTASQEYLSAMVIRNFGKLNFWPENWFQSFKYHCLPSVYLRHFLMPRKPKSETKVLAFHGNPNIQDALIGRWSDPFAKKAAKGWKKLYKTCRPTPWINEYWK